MSKSKVSELDAAVIRWARQYAPDVTLAELAVSLHVPLNTARRVARGVAPAVPSKLAEYRRTIGALAERLYEATDLTWEEIAEQVGVTRQHLHKCREEVGRG